MHNLQMQVHVLKLAFNIQVFFQNINYVPLVMKHNILQK